MQERCRTYSTHSIASGEASGGGARGQSNVWLCLTKADSGTECVCMMQAYLSLWCSLSECALGKSTCASGAV